MIEYYLRFKLHMDTTSWRNFKLYYVEQESPETRGKRVISCM